MCIRDRVYAWEDVLYWSFCTHNKAEWTGAFVFKLSSSLQPMAQWYIPCEQPVSLRVCADGRQILGCCTTGLEKGTLFVLDLATGDARHTDVPAGLSLQTQDQCIDRYGHVYLTEGQSTLWVYDRALQPIGRHRLKGRILQIVGQTQGAYVITHSPQASQMSPCVRVYEVLAP